MLNAAYALNRHVPCLAGPAGMTFHSISAFIEENGVTFRSACILTTVFKNRTRRCSSSSAFPLALFLGVRIGKQLPTLLCTKTSPGNALSMSILKAGAHEGLADDAGGSWPRGVPQVREANRGQGRCGRKRARSESCREGGREVGGALAEVWDLGEVTEKFQGRFRYPEFGDWGRWASVVENSIRAPRVFAMRVK